MKDEAVTSKAQSTDRIANAIILFLSILILITDLAAGKFAGSGIPNKFRGHSIAISQTGTEGLGGGNITGDFKVLGGGNVI